MDFNTIIFNAINGLAHQNIILDSFMIVLSKYAPVIFMCVLAIVYIMGVFTRNEKTRGVTIDTFMITIISLASGFLIGSIWYIPRPFVNNKVNLLIPHTIDTSFPSDHSIGTMSIAVGINKYKNIYGGILIIVSILVGISRVFVGHHYPTDVIGGYAIVFISSFFYERLLKNRVQVIYLKGEELLVKCIPALRQFI
jgi:undecaprenyl-diphosphatase